MNGCLNASQRIVGFICMIFLSVACSKEVTTVGLDLNGYNHTEEGIGDYSVELENNQRAGAGYLRAGTGGGGFTCCISVPLIWNRAMKATIRRTVVRDGVEQTITNMYLCQAMTLR